MCHHLIGAWCKLTQMDGEGRALEGWCKSLHKRCKTRLLKRPEDLCGTDIHDEAKASQTISLSLHDAVPWCRQISGQRISPHAWKKRTSRYEPTSRTRLAGALAAPMQFSITGDIQKELEILERSTDQWGAKHKAQISASEFS